MARPCATRPLRQAAAVESDIAEDRMEQFVDAWDSITKVQAAARGRAARNRGQAAEGAGAAETPGGDPSLDVAIGSGRVST